MLRAFFFFLCLTMYPSQGTIDELAPYIPYMSENLYYSLYKDTNDSHGLGKGHKFLSRGDIDKFRRFSVWAVNTFWPFAYYDRDVHEKACAAIRYVYRGSLDYIYRYYNIRTLYFDNWEYEVGYLTHQIIYRYQVMIETYHIVIKKFVKQPDKRVLPISPFFYLYTNMIEQAQLIDNYVNMLEESESKFRGITNPYWKDPITRSRRRKTRTKKSDSAENDTTIAGQTRSTTEHNYYDTDDEEEDPSIKAEEDRKKKQALLKQKRKEAKQYKKQIKKGLVTALTTGSYTHSKKNKLGPWQLDYGWSIETW